MHTKCGFPKVSWFASATTNDEYDVAYNTIDYLNITEDALFRINATSQQGGSMDLAYKFDPELKMNNSLEQVYNGTLKLNYFKDFYNCNGNDRNMYVTITRVKVGSSIEKKSELVAESRVMEAASQADYVSLVFTNTPGTNTYTGGHALAASLFAVLALALATLF